MREAHFSQAPNSCRHSLSKSKQIVEDFKFRTVPGETLLECVFRWNNCQRPCQVQGIDFIGQVDSS